MRCITFQNKGGDGSNDDEDDDSLEVTTVGVVNKGRTVAEKQNEVIAKKMKEASRAVLNKVSS